MKTQDDYTISLQGIVRLGMKLNELSPSDPQFDKIYDSLVQTMQNYHKGSQEDDSNQKSLGLSLQGKKGRIRG